MSCFVAVFALYPEYYKSLRKKKESLQNGEGTYADYVQAYSEFSFLRATELFSQSYEYHNFFMRDGGFIQRKWAEENGFPYSSDEAILIEQLNRVKVQILYLNIVFSEEYILAIKQKVPSIRLLVTWHGVVLKQADLQRFRHVDIVFTCLKNVCRDLNAHGIESHYINHFFTAENLKLITKQDSLKERYPVSFLGSLVLGDGYHGTRLKVIDACYKENIPLVVHSDLFFTFPFTGIWETFSPLLRLRTISGLLIFLGKCVHFCTGYGSRMVEVMECARKFGFHLYSLVQRFHAGLYGDDMFRGLARSDISLHCHIDAAENASAMRLFEATGMGSCLLTDWKPGLEELFKVDEEVLVYRSIPECIEKIRWLLAHPQKRQKIAEAGQRRTLREHTAEAFHEKMHRVIAQKLHKIKRCTA